MDLIKEMTRRNYKKHLDELDKILAACCDRNEKLQAENERLRGEHYKDEESAKMKDELEEARKTLRNSFKITQSESQVINEWIKQHEDAKHGGYPARAGAIGGRYSYIFVPTSIGTTGTISCSCGEKFSFREL